MNTITIKDIGPHTNLEIQCKPGVNVLSGRNEAGKTIAIRCVAALSGGDAKGLPIRDGSSVGVISGFGTTISVGMRTNRAGQLSDAEPLSERIDLATLVDPRIKDKSAANKHRIRALLTLTKTELSYEDFREILPEARRDEINAEFDSTDPVELAGAIKRQMEKKARQYKEDADEAASTAKAILQSLDGIDVTAECDEVALRRAHQTAVEAKAKIEAEMNAARLEQHRYKQAVAKLESSEAVDLKPLEDKVSRREATCAEQIKTLSTAEKTVIELENQLADAKRVRDLASRGISEANRALEDARSELKAVQSQQEAVEELRAIVATDPESGPQFEELEAAIAEVKEAEEAVANGVAIRRAREKQETAKEHLKKQEEAYAVEQVYRRAAAATDTVLTNAVKSKYFSVKGGELCAKDHAGKVRPYADLSEGARYKIAIKAVSESVAEGSFYFLPLDQNAWDGLNTQSRSEVAREAVEHNVAIITGEVSDDELRVYHFDGEMVAA